MGQLPQFKTENKDLNIYQKIGFFVCMHHFKKISAKCMLYYFNFYCLEGYIGTEFLTVPKIKECPLLHGNIKKETNAEMGTYIFKKKLLSLGVCLCYQLFGVFQLSFSCTSIASESNSDQKSSQICAYL